VTSCLLNENHDFLRLVINTVRNDIIGNNETFQCLALTMVIIILLIFFSMVSPYNPDRSILKISSYVFVDPMLVLLSFATSVFFIDIYSYCHTLL
jgi:hypothetical protein